MNYIKNTRKHIKMLVVLSVTGLLMASFTAPVLAGVFSVSPVRIYMTPKDRAVAVTITNDGDDELVMQADLYSWKQKTNGEDDLTLSEDLFLSPPIIKLAAKARQVVRLAVLAPSKSNDELYYRMIIREVPEAKPIQDKMQLQIALAFSLPVFITPKSAKSQLTCHVEKNATNAINAICENSGNAYARPREFVLKNATGETLAASEATVYILPGITRSYELKSTKSTIPTGAAKLSVTMDDATTRDYDVTIGN